jgi:hypothetical protein
MNLTTLILILLSFVTALFIALFQYVYRSRSEGYRNWILAALRAISIFSLLVLIINPMLERVILVEERPRLAVAVDNSASMAHLNIDEQAEALLESIRTNDALSAKFNIDYYRFGKEVAVLDSLSFDEGRTDISNLLTTYDQTYKGKSSAMMLISDGNQTFGSDVAFLKSGSLNPVFPVVLGDTTSYDDLEISKVNHNRYVFHKNKFEVELILNYVGQTSLDTKVQIFNGPNVVYSKDLNFDDKNNSQILSLFLSANTLGIQNYRVELMPMDKERNTLNNTREFAVEVIDQKTAVAIVYSTPHPDLGALKKAISSNDQREVTLLKPEEFAELSDEFQLVILYQPDQSFREILNPLFESRTNTLLIAGRSTDWELINSSQDYFTQEVTYQEELYQPVLNPAYSPFIINDLAFDDYPPLVSEFGAIEFYTNTNTAIYKSINGNETAAPQLTTWELDNEKHGVLLGEGIWRWRSQTYLNTGQFEEFDVFIGKLVQYLGSNQRRKRLVVDYRSIYNNSDEIVLTAQFFNKSYEPDNLASLSITIKDQETGKIFNYPLLNSESVYRVDLSGLSSGTYEFVVSNNEERISQSGQFKVIAFNIEQQFLSPDVDRLQALSENTGGELYNNNSFEQLVQTLIKNPDFVTIQKESREISPLIDWYYLLGLIALAVSLEWFIRKYNGLI